MLELPRAWQEITGTAIVKRLLGQTGALSEQTAIARALIRANLELLVQTRWLGTPVCILDSPPHTWQVGDFHFIYVPTVTDDILLDDAGWRQMPGRTKLIVPLHTTQIVEHAIRDYDQAPVCCSVISISELICLRILFTRADTGWDEPRTKLELLNLYNSFIEVDALRIDIRR